MTSDKQSASCKKPRESVWRWIFLVILSITSFLMEGLGASYGILYLEFLDLYGQGDFVTGWIFSCYNIISLFISPIAGLVVDRDKARLSMFLTTIVSVSGLLLVAFTSSIWITMFAWASAIGFGLSGNFLIGIALISHYFPFNRTLAFGIFMAAGGAGGIALPQFLHYTIDLYTVRGSIWLLAAFILHGFVPIILIKTLKSIKKEEYQLITTCDRSSSERNETIGDEKDIEGVAKNLQSPDVEFREINGKVNPESKVKISIMVYSRIRKFCGIDFILLCVFFFCFVFGHLGCVTYTPPLAEEKHLNDVQISISITIFGASGFVFRVLFGIIGNLRGSNIYMMAVIPCLIGMITNLLTSFYPVYFMFIINMMTMGLIGALFCLQGQYTVDTVGVQYSGLGLGVLNLNFGIPLALAPIIFGALKESTGSFVWVCWLCAGSLFIAAVCISASHWFSRRKQATLQIHE